MQWLIDDIRVLLDVALAALLGFLIGLERRFRAKEAGIKTHTIVAIGAAMMMAVSVYGFNGADTSRVAAQIVSGVGFLGAGIIIYKKHELHGLTTAAGIWATAGIAMACVGRMYVVAIGAAVMMILLQCLFHSNIPFFRSRKNYSIMISFMHTETEREIVKDLFEITRYHRLVMERKDGYTYYHAVLNTNVEYSSAHLSRIMTEHPFIISIERVDEN
jgi:putative Mg2+ transporter-C (MgtC) family protein